MFIFSSVCAPPRCYLRDSIVRATTGTAASNLATCLLDLGKINECEPFMRCAVQIDVAKHGSDHVETATSLNNLAAVLEKQGKLVQAEQEYRKVRKIFLANSGDRDISYAVRGAIGHL